MRVCYAHVHGGTSGAAGPCAAPGATIDNALSLTRHFSRLVSLLLDEGKPVDEQKAALRAATLVAKSVSARLVIEDGHLAVNGLVVPGALAGVHDLERLMALHRVEEITIDAGAGPADVLGLARLIAMHEASTSDAADFGEKFTELGQGAVHVRRAASTAAAPARTGAAFRSLHDVSRATGEHVALLLASLDAASTPVATDRVLDEVTGAAERATREGRVLDAAAVFSVLIQREAEEADPELRRALGARLRRLTTPSVLRPVARLLLADPTAADLAERILRRLGHDGVDATVDLFIGATTAAERETCRAVLTRLPSTGKSLILMLDDPRWYMVRQAAELLGEMREAEAGQALAELLRHPDARVRRAATRALGRLDGILALEAAGRSLSDSQTTVRLEAIAALAARKGDRAAALLAGAFEAEHDIEVQHGLLAALGRVVTGEAVQALVAVASAAGGLFTQKKNTTLRVAAVFALGDTRTPAAFTALKALAGDREKEVRDAVARALNAPRSSAA